MQRHEPNPDMRAMCKLSFEGFARFLMDPDNFAFHNERVKQDVEVNIVNSSAKMHQVASQAVFVNLQCIHRQKGPTCENNCFTEQRAVYVM